MRKTLLAILMVSFSTMLWAQTTRLHRVRSRFFQATKSEAVLNEVAKVLNEEDNSQDAVLMAYAGAVEAIRAKFVWSPYGKLHHLKKGLKQIDKALVLAPEAIEIRFLRFLVEHHIPSMAGVDTHLDQDKAFIMDNLDQMGEAGLEKDFATNLLDFLEKTGRYTSAEIAQIRVATFGNSDMIRVARTR